MGIIAEKYLGQLKERTAAIGTQLSFPGEMKDFLVAKCPGADGARQLRRLVQTEVEGPLACHLLRCSRKPAKLEARIEEGKVVF